jgi:hypothetical protein
MTADALFDLDVPTPKPIEKLSAGKRLTRRQAADLAAGRHPLTRGPLHPDTAPAEPRDAPGLRCGGCRFRKQIGGGRRGYPKCDHPNTPYSHGPATDVRSYWSACPLFEPTPQTGA